MYIRAFRADDFDGVLDLTVRAFASIQHGISVQLGAELFNRQNGQWREDYRRTLLELTTPEIRHRFLLAATEEKPVGYAAWTVHPGSAGPQGEIALLAVDPRHQRSGLGRRLIDAACEAMRAAGCVVASVSTGGDDAHAPARAVYTAAGFTALPTVYYSRVL